MIRIKRSGGVVGHRKANELPQVLGLLDALASTRARLGTFARKHRIHPSTLSRLKRVRELPEDLLHELASLPELSRTHLEVIATAPPERREDLLADLRSGTYRLRALRESSCVAFEAAPAPEATPVPTPEVPRLAEVERALGATREEAAAFAVELLLVLVRSGPERVLASFQAFRTRDNRTL
jgi:hypothetical protein